MTLHRAARQEVAYEVPASRLGELMRAEETLERVRALCDSYGDYLDPNRLASFIDAEMREDDEP